MRIDLKTRLVRASAAIAVGFVAVVGVASTASVTAHRHPARTTPTIKATTRSSSTIRSSPTISRSLTVPIRRRRWVSSSACSFGRPD